MSESFIRRHRAEWKRFDDILTRLERLGMKSLTTEEIRSFGQLYRKVSTDLAYARAQQFDMELIDYLNDLTGRGYNRLYLNESSGQGLIRFFRVDIPSTLQKYHHIFWIALGLIYLSVFLGYIVTAQTPHAAQAIFPRIFGEELLKRYQADKWFNNPLAQRPVVASMIMVNNIKVSIYAFALGTVACLPTIYMLAYNGLLLGHIAAYFGRHGYAYAFWAAVLPHGIIELTAIAFAGAAGWILGMAWMFPGNYKRSDSLSIKGREAGHLFLISVLLLLVAGTIEGMFSTIPTKVIPNEGRLLVAALSVVFLAYLGHISGLFRATLASLKRNTG